MLSVRGAMSKLAVFFPGIGYTVDKPLLYYMGTEDFIAAQAVRR